MRPPGAPGGPTNLPMDLESLRATLEDSANFRKQAVDFLRANFPDQPLATSTEVVPVDVFQRGPAAQPVSGEPGAAALAAAQHAQAGQLAALGQLGLFETAAAGAATIGAAGGMFHAGGGGFIGGDDSQQTPFARYLGMQADERSKQRLREFEENVQDEQYWGDHLEFNYWWDNDDRNAIDRRNQDDLRFDERRSDERKGEERAYERRSEESRAESAAWDRRNDQLAMERELEMRRSRDMDEERAALERERQYRDDYRFLDDDE